MQASYRDIDFRPAEAHFEQRADGTLIVICPTPLDPYPARYTEFLERWAREAPDRVFIGQRDRTLAGEPWRTITYAEALRQVRALAQALLDQGVSVERPVAILSGNDIEQQLLMLAALHIGVPVSPVSPSYSLLATDYAKLRHVLGLLTPGLVFANDGTRFAAALAATLPDDCALVISSGDPGRQARRFADLRHTTPTDAVDTAAACVTGDTVGKLLFTSGSTGTPKGVINTHRMLCSNLIMMRQTMRFVTATPPVLVDWLPWNHTAGGNHDFGVVLANGGSFYIDDGRPTPAGMAETLRNLREIATTIYITMPKGYEDLVPALRAEPELREIFYSRLQLIFYAGAALAKHVWDDLQELAIATIGQRLYMMTGLGSTETGPFALCASKEFHGPGIVGLPAPGVVLKLVPNAGKLEMRVKGPAITQGYWRQPDLTRAAFDEEGFYRMGDALRFADPENRLAGFLFDGRINEDFKLTTGTWVSVGALRTQLIAQFAPYLRDVVIAGHNQDFIGLLLVPHENELARHCPDGANPLTHPASLSVLAEKLAAHAAAATGSSQRAIRAVVLTEPLLLDRGELTDKGSINQRAVLESRAALVDLLYAEAPPAHIIRADAFNALGHTVVEDK